MRQFLKFGGVGVSNTAIDFGLFTLLTQGLAIGALGANVLSYTAGVANSFVINRMWTFAGGEYRDAIAYQVSMFALSNALGLLGSTGVLWLALLWLAPLSAKGVSIVAILFWNYWFTKRFVYRRKAP